MLRKIQAVGVTEVRSHKLCWCFYGWPVDAHDGCTAAAGGISLTDHLVVHKKRRNILLKLNVIKGNISVLLFYEFCFLRVLRNDL